MIQQTNAAKMNASVVEIFNGISFFITNIYKVNYNCRVRFYLPSEFTSGNGTKIEAMIQQTRAVKMISSVFVMSNCSVFFIT